MGGMAAFQALLPYQAAKIELRFYKWCIEWKDLLILQYRNEPVWLKVAATCAKHGKCAQKTSLTLSEILTNRATLNNSTRW